MISVLQECSRAQEGSSYREARRELGTGAADAGWVDIGCLFWGADTEITNKQ